MIVLSKPQKDALEQIKKLHKWMRENLHETDKDCWFTQDQLKRVTLHTLRALTTKGFLESVESYELGNTYFRWTGKEIE